jgi:hypothetical protein
VAKQAGYRHGWQTIECVLYNETVTKNYKMFLETYSPVGGIIRVVLVEEDHCWFALFSTDPNVSVVEILNVLIGQIKSRGGVVRLTSGSGSSNHGQCLTRR